VKTYRLLLTSAADKEIESLPEKVVERLLPAIRELANEPRPRGCKKLAGTKDTFRIRVGDYRVIYEVHDKEVIVLVIRVTHRKDAYQ
jgi:mRNA interferase RelE/StbE